MTPKAKLHLLKLGVKNQGLLLVPVGNPGCLSFTYTKLESLNVTPFWKAAVVIFVLLVEQAVLQLWQQQSEKRRKCSQRTHWQA